MACPNTMVDSTETPFRNQCERTQCLRTQRVQISRRPQTSLATMMTHRNKTRDVHFVPIRRPDIECRQCRSSVNCSQFGHSGGIAAILIGKVRAQISADARSSNERSWSERSWNKRSWNKRSWNARSCGGLTSRASKAGFHHRRINCKRCGGNALWRKHRLSELTCSLTERAESTLLEGQCGADRLRERDRIFRTK
jgi:hypothetical protein